MTREEAINKWIIPAIKNTWNEKKCNEILKALEQETCDDAISREKVSELLNEGWWKGIYPREAIMALPSATPMPKIGKWIYDKKEDSYRCSLCTFPCHKDNLGAIPTKYCANCGSYNGGDTNVNDK